MQVYRLDPVVRMQSNPNWETSTVKGASFWLRAHSENEARQSETSHADRGRNTSRHTHQDVAMDDGRSCPVHAGLERDGSRRRHDFE